MELLKKYPFVRPNFRKNKSKRTEIIGENGSIARDESVNRHRAEGPEPDVPQTEPDKQLSFLQEKQKVSKEEAAAFVKILHSPDKPAVANRKARDDITCLVSTWENRCGQN